MDVVASVVVIALLLTIFGVWTYLALWFKTSKKAQRYAVTLKHNEGAFVGLCIKKRYGTWTFVDVRVMPNNPGGAVVKAADGELYVPTRNILYYQEIANVAE